MSTPAQRAKKRFARENRADKSNAAAIQQRRGHRLRVARTAFPSSNFSDHMAILGATMTGLLK